MAEPRRPRPPSRATSVSQGPLSLDVRKLLGGGRALAHHADATWMIRGALPGERVEVRPTGRRAGVVEADVVGVVGHRHPARLPEPCPHAPVCGGCDWPFVDPAMGAELKRDVAAESAGRFLELAEMLRQAPVQASPGAYRLRNRLHWDPKRRALGFYGFRSWHVASIEHCRIISPSLIALLPVLGRALRDRCPHPVDIEVIEGADGTVAALRPGRAGPRTVPASALPKRDDCPGVDGFHRLDGSPSVQRGWGRDSVRMDLPVALEVPVGSFFQGNRHLLRWLFDTVAALIGPGPEPVFDLHAGVGFLTAAAQTAGRSELTAVEVHRQAAAAAGRNLPDAHVVASTAEAFVGTDPELPTNAVLITDPPRSGMSRELRAAIGSWRPRKVVMLGCDPATWSRDAAELLQSGYRLLHLELADLFPFTHHIEVLAVLESA